MSADGATPFHNTNAGLSINNSMGNRVQGNFCADTVVLNNANSAGNTLMANAVGLLTNFASAGLDNGIEIYNGAHDNYIGLPASGNLIAHTSVYGIYIASVTSINNAIFSRHFFRIGWECLVSGACDYSGLCQCGYSGHGQCG